MSNTVRTQTEIPCDLLELSKQRGEAHGVTPAQQILEVLTAYLHREVTRFLEPMIPFFTSLPRRTAVWAIYPRTTIAASIPRTGTSGGKKRALDETVRAHHCLGHLLRHG